MATTPKVAVQILVAEYERIQGDIRQHKNTQQTILNFIIIIIGIELATLSQIGHINGKFIGVLLVAPIPFALLGIYHSAYTMRIHRIAGQFDSNLRRQLEKFGKVTLDGYHFVPTRRIWHLASAETDGRLTYMALACIKALPQLIPLTLFPILANWPWAWWQFLLFAVDVTFLITSFVIQHD